MGFTDAILGLWTDCYLFGLALKIPGSYGLMVTNGIKVQLYKLISSSGVLTLLVVLLI